MVLVDQGFLNGLVGHWQPDMTGIFAAMTGPRGGGSAILNNAAVSSVGVGSRTAGWKIDTDGFVYTLKQAAYTARYQWTTDSPANFEVKATLVSGAVTTGTTGSWLSCSTDREWTVISDASASLTIEVRDSATAIVLASCSVDLYAETV
mgnify:FL=1